jgi:hypothetical protein
MWSRVAEEMAIPWRAAEAMHWQLEEQEMARRAGVVPFSLTNATSILTSRRESATRSMCPPLPSVAELTAGVPSPRTCLGVGLYVEERLVECSVYGSENDRDVTSGQPSLEVARIRRMSTRLFQDACSKSAR